MNNKFDSIDEIFPILRRNSGIDFSLYKLPTLHRAVAKRLHTLKMRSLADYIRFLKKDPNEAGNLTASMLIHVTAFFRDPQVFRALTKRVFPRLEQPSSQKPLRIWAPGCGTGEEVYSLAMALAQYSQTDNIPLLIFGTDLNEDVLKKARSGIYQKKDLKGVNPQYLRRFFVPLADGRYQIHKNIRGMCTFAKQNLVDDPPFSRVGLISCRNVLIYLKPELQEKVIKTFHYALNPAGVLLLGTSENIGVLGSSLFNVLDKNHSIYIKKKTTGRPDVKFRLDPSSKTSMAAMRTPVELYQDFNVGREIDRVIIERTRSAAVLINEAYEIVESRGNISPYFSLPSGPISLNVIKAANDDFAVELRMMLKKASKTRSIQRRQIEMAGGLMEVEVLPLNKPVLKENFLLILLRPAQPHRDSGKDIMPQSQKAARLQKELTAAKALMQAIVEEHEQSMQELKTANEEALCSNEELQSLNEELNTAKEELESTNEELTTVNEQLHEQMEALRRSEERFKILVESVRDYAIFMLDPQGHVMTWNIGAERLTQYKREEIIGSHMSRFFAQEGKGKAEYEMRLAVRTGVYREEGWRRRKDGSQFWASVVLTALRDSKGKLRGFAKVTYDMSEQRKAQEALRQSEERFRLMVEAVQDYAIFMLDVDGRVLTWNIGAERLKGYKIQEILGKHISVFYTNEDRRAHVPQKILEHAVKHDRVIDEGWRVRKNGTRFWANVTITALRNKEGVLQGFSKVTRDMTERKAKEVELQNAYNDLETRVKDRTRQLQRYAQELTRSNADLQQFAYIASHDLQEPLRTVSIYVDLLRRHLENNANKDVETFFTFVQEGAQRAQRLIKELLEYSRIGASGQSFNHVSMETVVTHVLSLMGGAIKENDATITYDPLPTLPVDRFQMEQLIQNLISNAIKYRSKDVPPRIHIRAVRKSGEWIFSVRDNGIGIEPQYHQYIFTVFKRLHTAKDYPGTGIGLALCKKIIERHGGRIWIESALGRGANFLFSIPAVAKTPDSF